MTPAATPDPALVRELYLGTLARCAPGKALRDAVERGRISLPAKIGAIVSLGKCAAPLAVAASELTGVATGLVIHPEGYGDDTRLPSGFDRLVGSHPIPTEASRDAARRAVRFVREQREPVLFLISGGASACMEDALEPHIAFDELVRVNALLVSSGLPIDAVNTIRRHLSSVKGGRLGALAPPGSVSFVHSDVPPGMPELVGSGPTAHDPSTLADAAAILRTLHDEVAARLATRLESGAVPETPKRPAMTLQLIADSESLVAAAIAECRDRGFATRAGQPLDGAVDEVTRRLAREASTLGPGVALVAAGEATVEVRGAGRGGRCTELAARLVLASDAAGFPGLCGLVGSSDGRDGSSPAAAVLIRPSGAARLDPHRAAEALARSASYELVADYGEPVIMMPTGNNLRDIAMLFHVR